MPSCTDTERSEEAVKLKPFKTWMLYDAKGTYFPMLHRSRSDALTTISRILTLVEYAEWHIARVEVRPTSTRKQQR